MPAYMPFLDVPAHLGRRTIQVEMVRDGDRYVYDLDALDAAFAAGGHLLVLCNPYNPLGRVMERDELDAIAAVVDRHGGRVFADEIHAPLVYPGHAHVPYASLLGGDRRATPSRRHRRRRRGTCPASSAPS